MKLISNFHPRLFGFAGLSGSGKTTLIEKLIMELSHMRVGYIKHDAHKFNMDHPGKDTFRQYAAGAEVVFINDSEHMSLTARGESFALEKEYFKDCDIVLVEGHKYSPHPKFIFLDQEGLLLEEVKAGKITNVLGFISQDGVPETFHRDNVKSIVSFMKKKIEESVKPPLGLILAGGQSSRMGVDKTLINYHGSPQVEHLYKLLKEVGLETFISCREEQFLESNLKSFPRITDRFINFGPLGGILSAMASYPGRAWFVLACDLPLVSGERIKEILEARDPLKQATAYFNEERKHFEPLFAIYESTAYSRMLHFLSEGVTCPQKVLFNSSIKKLELKSQSFLLNVNTPEERDKTFQRLKAGAL